MNRLQLATLLSWAGDQGIQGRKRLQKVAFFLQHAGCPLDCKYTLHHFGPYSRDVADACDEMVAVGLVIETGEPQNGVMQYAYSLTPESHELLTRTPNAQSFESLGRSLINEAIWPLELGSTILYFYGQSRDGNRRWTERVNSRTCPPTRSSVEWH